MALKDGLEHTNEAEERPLLTSRLAAAAEMYALLNSKGDVSAIYELVQSEVRVHGWSFIAGATGKDIANKWVAFIDAVGIKR